MQPLAPWSRCGPAGRSFLSFCSRPSPPFTVGCHFGTYLARPLLKELTSRHTCVRPCAPPAVWMPTPRFLTGGGNGPPPPASLSGREPPAGIASTVDERGASFGFGTRVPASLMSRGPFGATARGRWAGLVWGQEPPSEPLLWSLCSRPWAGPREGLTAREMAHDPPSPLSLRINPGEGDAGACGGRGHAAGTRGGGSVASRPSPAPATVPLARGQGPAILSGLRFPIHEQRVGLAGCPLGGGRWGPFLSPWASGKPRTSSSSSAPGTCPCGSSDFLN